MHISKLIGYLKNLNQFHPSIWIAENDLGTNYGAHLSWSNTANRYLERFADIPIKLWKRYFRMFSELKKTSNAAEKLALHQINKLYFKYIKIENHYF